MRDPGGRPRTQADTCTVDGCDKKPNARSLCKMHYGRWLIHGDPLKGAAPTRKPCTVDGCPELSTARGWCPKHYYRWKRHGDPVHLEQAEYATPPPKPCSIDGCDNPTKARGWCDKHYLRWKRHGSPLAGAPKHEPAPCTIDGCNDPNKSLGYCNKHYKRWKKHGDPLAGAAKPRPERVDKPAKPTLVDPPEHLVAFLRKREARLKGSRSAANVTDGRGAGSGMPARQNRQRTA